MRGKLEWYFVSLLRVFFKFIFNFYIFLFYSFLLFFFLYTGYLAVCLFCWFVLCKI